jgi:hypothetical protein
VGDNRIAATKFNYYVEMLIKQRQGPVHERELRMRVKIQETKNFRTAVAQITDWRGAGGGGEL